MNKTKKIFLFILFPSVILIGIAGCKKEKTITIDELSNINNIIIDYFSSDVVLDNNFCFNYIDEENLIVIVGLLDNSKEQQEIFKENVVDSDLIKFVQCSKNINLPINK